MEEYRYNFEKGSKKHQCPECHKKRFVRFVDAQTGDYLPVIYGRCDREMKCGYHLNPYTNGYAKNNSIKNEFIYQAKKPIAIPKQVFFSKEIFYKTRTGYEENGFIQNLLNNISFPFNSSDIEKIIAQYHLGTIIQGYRKGATTFPFIDVNNNVRTVQVKQFDKQNHTTGTDFLHSMITKKCKRNKKQIPKWLVAYNNNESKVSCLFGEHLLNKYPYNPIALVEAPKTAIYGTLYFGYPNNPNNLLWLAVYNLSSLNLKKCKVLKGRKVYLFPDLSEEGKAYQLWSNKAANIQEKLEDVIFKVSDVLEQLAPNRDREKGRDIADYLIELDWKDFREKSILEPKLQSINIKTTEVQKSKINAIVKAPQSIKQSIKIEENNSLLPINESEIAQKVNWSNEIKELEAFFNNRTLPKKNIFLNQATKITNVTVFVNSHLQIIKTNNGNIIYLPYLNRLRCLKDIL